MQNARIGCQPRERELIRGKSPRVAADQAIDVGDDAILTNTSLAPITGTFNGLAEGAVFTQDAYQFQITYVGGTGGDSVVLTRLA